LEFLQSVINAYYLLPILHQMAEGFNRYLIYERLSQPNFDFHWCAPSDAKSKAVSEGYTKSADSASFRRLQMIRKGFCLHYQPARGHFRIETASICAKTRSESGAGCRPIDEL